VNISVADVADAYINEGIPQAVAAFGASEVGIGVQTYQDSPSTMLTKVRNAHAQDTYGKPWDALSAQQQTRLHRTHPDIEEAELEKKKQKEPLRTLSLDEQVQTGRRIEANLSKEVRGALRDAGVRPSISRRMGDFWLNDVRYEAYERRATAEIEARMGPLLRTGRLPQLQGSRKTNTVQNAVDAAKARARAEIMREINRGNL
jgi:hypothetical protein